MVLNADVIVKTFPCIREVFKLVKVLSDGAFL